MVKCLLGMGAAGDANDSTTGWVPLANSYGNSWISFASATEVAQSPTCRSPGTADNLVGFAEANARTTDTTFTFKKNGANSSLTITYGSAVTGKVADTTNSSTLADGDTYTLAVTTSTGGGTLDLKFVSVDYDVTTGSKMPSFSTGDGTFNNASGTEYNSLAGEVLNRAAVTDKYFPIAVAGTLSDFQIGIKTNARTTTTVFTVYVEGAQGNGTVSATSGQTGFFEDTSNTDVVSAGNKIAHDVVTGTGTEALVLSMAGVWITTDGAGFLANTNGFYVSSTDEFSPFIGECDDAPTESPEQFTCPQAFTWDTMSVYVNANASTATTTVNSRLNTVDGNQTVAFTSGVTGVQRDTTNSDSVSVDDLLTYQALGMNASFSMAGISAFCTPAAAGGLSIPVAMASYRQSHQSVV